ncbi:MAG: hypothetical protein IPP35_10845 [Elusimicrobia bacterium]|nr:hypothetical protein [Elusimicrobiota bacterium]
MPLRPCDSRGGAETFLHRSPAAVPLSGTVVFVILTALLPNQAWPFFLGAGGFLVAVAALARLPFVPLLKRVLWLEPFALSIAFLLLFQPGGLGLFFGRMAKSTLCLGAVVLFSQITSFTEVLKVFRRFRAMGLLVTTIALAHRYTFVLTEEMTRLRRARRCRTFARSRRSAWAGLSGVAAHLFIRSSERAERVYGAMRARGWKT